MSRAGLIASVFLAGCGGRSDSVCQEALVPAYVPADALLRLAERRPLPSLLVVNPASGPGPAADPVYRRGVAAARANGARVLGYVPTAYGTRARADVARDVQRYRDWYGVDGVFLDEAAHDVAGVAYYAELAEDARAAGADVVVLNPGVVPTRAYFDFADVVVTFEGPYSEYDAWLKRRPKWLDELEPDHTANLVYATPPALARTRANHVYLTSGTLPHPWGTVEGCT